MYQMKLLGVGCLAVWPRSDRGRGLGEVLVAGQHLERAVDVGGLSQDEGDLRRLHYVRS